MDLYKATIFLLLAFVLHSCKGPGAAGGGKLPDIHEEVSIAEIRTALDARSYSIYELTGFYLQRIRELSFAGPELNAVITLNPDALKIAEELDAELRSGKSRGPLHGIPVLLKDNIDTGDKMPCTAGSLIMKDSYPGQDSPIAAQLRQAGAVILGKANLSEWANFHSLHSSSGWSALGGQCRNPYDLSRNPCGSSAGSGVAVAANLCVIAIGTETNGSIVCPANNNGIVGIKPTVGLISRRGVIPISFTQDTGGPMARSVRDAAIALGCLTAADSLDRKTLAVGRVAHEDYTQFLDADGLKGKRIGFWTGPLDGYTRMSQLMKKTVEDFESAGASIVEVEQIMDRGTSSRSYEVLLYEFKDGLNAYLAGLGEDAPVRDLEELIELTFVNPEEMHYHDHEIFKLAQAMEGLDSEDYLASLAFILNASRKEGIDRVMDEHSLDAIIAPTGGPAWKTDLTNGDNFGLFSSSPAAIAGYPSVVVPMGQLDGLPVGVSIFGRAWSEPVLLEIAYAYEQATHRRFTPTCLKP